MRGVTIPRPAGREAVLANVPAGPQGLAGVGPLGLDDAHRSRCLSRDVLCTFSKSMMGNQTS